MVPMRILMDVEKDPIFSDAEDSKRLAPEALSAVSAVGILTDGMKSGLPAVIVRVDLPDGTFVVAQTSLRLFQAAAIAFKARYGEVLG